MGQLGSALGNPNTMAPDPSGFSGSEIGARFLGKGIQGGLQGLANQPQGPLRPAGGGMAPMQIPQTPAIQPQIYTPGNNGSQWAGDYGNNGKNRNFYGS